MKTSVCRRRIVLLLCVMIFILSGCGSLSDAKLSESSEKTPRPTQTPESLQTVEPTPDISAASSSDTGSKVGDYEITFWGTRVCPQIEWEDEEFEIWYPWIEIVGNGKLSEKIGNNISRATCAWVTDPFLSNLKSAHNFKRFWSDPPIILFPSDRYFSFMMMYNFETIGDELKGSRTLVSKQAFTIDMQTGEFIRLEDLIDINASFVSYLHLNAFSDLSTDLIMEYLTECSTGLMDYAPEDSHEDIRSKVSCSTFYLESGKLTLLLGGYLWETIDLDDIEEFLKVPKW